MACSRKPSAYPDDRSYVIYRLRAEARWHDGKPVTPEDVIFSFDALKKNSPMFSAYYQHIVKCEKVGDRDVKFTFDGPGNRELPMITGAGHRAAEALVGRHRRAGQASATSARPRWRFRWVRDPIASRNSSPAARSCSNASRIIGARTCRTASARTISTNCAGFLPRRPAGARSVQGRCRSTGCSSAAPRNGRSPTTFRRCARSA